MKFSELKGEAALEALADMIEPAAEIVADVDFVNCLRRGNKMKAVQLALRNHKKAIIQILAAADGQKPDTFEVNLLTLPKKLIEVFNDPEVVDLFQLQGQEQTSSGSAMENTEAKEK